MSLIVGGGGGGDDHFSKISPPFPAGYNPLFMMKPPPFLLPPLPDIDLRNILHISLMRQTI